MSSLCCPDRQSSWATHKATSAPTARRCLCVVNYEFWPKGAKPLLVASPIPWGERMWGKRREDESKECIKAKKGEKGLERRRSWGIGWGCLQQGVETAKAASLIRSVWAGQQRTRRGGRLIELCLSDLPSSPSNSVSPSHMCLKKDSPI